jgi:hypothetical protein
MRAYFWLGPKQTTGSLWLVDGGITVGKGAVGALAKLELTKPPSATIDLHHSHDGTRNQDIVKSACSKVNSRTSDATRANHEAANRAKQSSQT